MTRTGMPIDPGGAGAAARAVGGSAFLPPDIGGSRPTLPPGPGSGGRRGPQYSGVFARLQSPLKGQTKRLRFTVHHGSLTVLRTAGGATGTAAGSQ